MHKCDICKEVKYYLCMVNMHVKFDDMYQEGHKEICYKCLNNIGFKTPHKGD